jgi:DNA replication licensing factor MCM5
MLKFVEKVAPIAVYTSGKGSSAAGLTASVVRDPTSKEFYLEGGAMVVADQGIVCIDEFDKMNSNDRVAIHEAMEQQTISVAKAGITTMLNARTSVLAAANPVFGKYDDMRQPFENIEFQSTILSRFDMIFLIKDVRNETKDRTIAQHVIGIHMKGQTSDPDSAEIDVNLLKRYISYCRCKFSPRLSQTAAETLQNHYVSIRSTMRDMEQTSGRTAPIPITVRQLEAIIRIAEALARMRQSHISSEEQLQEAIRLFKASTMDAATAGVTTPERLTPALQQEVEHAENIIKLRLPIGSSVSEKRLISELSHRNMTVFAIRMAIRSMVQRDELQYRNQRKTLRRRG